MSIRKSATKGEQQNDGTILAGISPDTGKPMYALPHDTPGKLGSGGLKVRWDLAMACADARSGYPKDTFRVPTRRELNVLFNNRARIGGFDETGVFYWSSEEHAHGSMRPTMSDRPYHNAAAQRFSDGMTLNLSKTENCLVRLVRD